MNSIFSETDNPIFRGKRLSLVPTVPECCEHHVVYRPKNTLFGYSAWPSVCRDEFGTLYAVSAAFAMEHICPFTKFVMYISKNNGETWSPPIVVQDSYLSDGSGGILYLGNGRMLLHWCYHPGDVFYGTYYNRICGTLFGGEADGYGKLRAAMMDLYPQLPAEKLVGGSFVRMSEDYGITWSDPVRIPVSSPHGPTLCRDGSIVFLGKEYYASPAKTLEPDAFSEKNRVHAKNYEDWINQIERSRAGMECAVTPIVAYASTDGGYTWQKRGICEKPEEIKWYHTSEPYAIELDDGTLLGTIRVEDEGRFENDYTIYISRSSDGGCTWSAWECTHISGAPAHLLKHSSGKLICAVGRRIAPNFGEYAYVSEDNGRSWTKEYVINDVTPNNDLGYPCSVELEDGSILTVYYQKKADPITGEFDEKPCIQCTRWTL